MLNAVTVERYPAGECHGMRDRTRLEVSQHSLPSPSWV